MKKILFVAAWLTFAGCTKQVSSPESVVEENRLSSTNADEKFVTEFAIIDYMEDPEADGLGWVLKTAKNTFYKPTNLPEEFYIEELKVEVTYLKTRQNFPCRCLKPVAIVEVISIKTVDFD